MDTVKIILEALAFMVVVVLCCMALPVAFVLSPIFAILLVLLLPGVIIGVIVAKKHSNE